MILVDLPTKINILKHRLTKENNLNYKINQNIFIRIHGKNIELSTIFETFSQYFFLYHQIKIKFPILYFFYFLRMVI